MIDTNKREKIKRFLADKVMSDAVFEVLLDSYIKPRAKLEVTTLAAERIAINLLDEAWKELQKYQGETSASSASGIQTAL